ncbi:PAS domain S-box-containing protein [Noviherbaspirillum humi]|uniref:histidine kinase n=1 Tax=Noviherbaspirillum humi TaxID=1688639 RepID=A0A239M483_9BURK|nr:PAS domain S-box protein [Noviherbaspirillum humi]SNT37400.1 PAS domain S-box-containing protein [Noviherbaspirillum humi]
MHDLYEHAPCGYLSTLPDGTIVKANATFLEWTGYRRENLLGHKRFQELLPIAGRIYYDTHFAPLLLMQEQVKELAFEVTCATGQRLPMLLNSSLKRAADGTPLLIRTTLLDARSRRAYEQELLLARRRAEAAEVDVRRLNQHLQELLAARTKERDRLWNLSQDILAVGTIDGRFLSVNPAFTTVLGWTPDDLAALSYADLLHSEDHSVFLRNMDRLAAGEAIHGAVVRHRHKNGSDRWIAWDVVPDSALLHMIGRDVTEERQRAQAVQRLEEALHQAKKMEAIGQLTGGIAHDFNNMLAGIAGNLELMRIRLQQGQIDEMRRHIDAAEAVADRATAMVQQLLTFSRQQALAPKPTDLRQPIGFMRGLIEQSVGSSIEVRITLPDDLHPVLCDRNQFERALLNLAINARDAMPEGGTLAIAARNVSLDMEQAGLLQVPPGDFIMISVADTGSGMPREVMERAFDPFFTTKPIGQGTGLGLSMIQGFIKQSGGAVRIDSTLRVGTTISLYLPRHVGEVAVDTQQSMETTGVACPTAEATVLLVDDEAALRSLLAELLTSQGHAVLQAENGTAGLELLKSSPVIDLLVCDVGLPGSMNGKQLAEAARALRPALKILFITGYANKVDIGKGLHETGIDIMLKPFRLDDFTRQVARLLRA